MTLKFILIPVLIFIQFSLIGQDNNDYVVNGVVQTQSEQIIILKEYVPGLHEEIRLYKNKKASKKLVRKLKAEGFDLKKLQKLVDKSEEQIFLFTKYTKDERPAQLGILMQEHEKGVRITEIFKDKTDEILDVGDIIIGLNGRLISKPDGLELELSSYKGSDRIKLTWLRDGEEMSKTIELDQKLYYKIYETPTLVKLIPMRRVSR